MRLIFARQRSISSLLIRFFTGSRWSHVAIVEDDTNVIDATFLHGGVRRRPLADLLTASSRTETLDLMVPNERAAMRWLQAQIGLPYDWTAVTGILFRSPGWAVPDRWFCSELAEAAVMAGGLKRFREDAARITPEHVWMVV